MILCITFAAALALFTIGALVRGLLRDVDRLEGELFEARLRAAELERQLDEARAPTRISHPPRRSSAPPGTPP